MNADRPRFQCTVRELLEIVFWISVGIGAFKGAHNMGPVDSRVTPDLAIIGLQAFWLFLLFVPGAAFGAAIGVIVRRRQEMAVVGLFVWPFVMCAGILCVGVFFDRAGQPPRSAPVHSIKARPA